LRSSHSEPLPAELAEAIEQARDRLNGLGSTIHFFPTIGSTNDVALSLAARGDRDLAIVIADEQTAGRGRRGRTWFSPPGSGLYVSIVLTPGRARPDPARATTLLTLAAGVALAEAIEEATALEVVIKWPNDLLLLRRKLAGILAEAVPATRSGAESISAVVLGYGINVGPMAYPPELGDRATSLEAELGRPVDRVAVCVETLAAVARRYADLLDGRFDAILDAWRARAPGSVGAKVEWQAASGRTSGVTAGVDDRGALLVRVGDRTERLVAGEVVWL
jgi:BirA family transcriptional regulator, biotin operon repressor / biotin---[acetyl-CoA-carboxylase] ligase